MGTGKYRWAALAAALLVPSFLFAAAGRKNKSSVQGIKNLKAFLLMIQYSEGTIGKSAYQMLYGGSVFNSYTQHPNKAVTRWGITSTAAGAYQLLYGTWAGLQQELQLHDFSPASQDAAAVELIRKKDALVDVLGGRISDAVYKCRKLWASFPGAGYGQGEKNIENLLRFYAAAGGQLTT